MFNSETNTIYPDPNWVPPAPEPAPTEPTEWPYNYLLKQQTRSLVT
jgi:hypothetical protein